MRLKHLTAIKGGAGFPHEEQNLVDEELAFYKVAALEGASPEGILRNPDHRISRETARRLGAHVFPRDTVVFAKVGAALLLNRFRQLAADACIDNNMMGLEPLGTAVLPRFLLYAMQAKDLSLVVNPGAVPSVNGSQIAEERIWCPSPVKQQRIANFLDEQTARIDALIAEKERLAELLKDIEEVTAFDLVVRGAVPNVERISYTETWLTNVPAHWGLAKLQQIASIGNGSTPKRDNEVYWKEGDTPWLNSGSVNTARIREASDFVTELALKQCHLPLVRPGSTLVALTGQGKTRGNAAMVEFASTINQHLAYVSLFNERMSDEYLWVVLTGFYSVLRYISDGGGSTKGALTCEQLNRLRVPVPPPGEQAAIVKAYRERIQATEVLVTNVTEHIDRLREYRSSLISAAVTGQLDISTFKVAA